MEFIIKFGDGIRYPVLIKSEEVRLPGFRLARERFPGIRMEKIVEIYPEVASEPEIKVPEEIAIASGHFKNSNYINVKVPGKSLNRFHSYVPVLNKDGEVGWESVIDEAAILAAWARAGFPLKWDPAAEDEDME